MWDSWWLRKLPNGWVFPLVSLTFPWLPLRQWATALRRFWSEIGLERAGAPGTTAALALLNDQVKKGGVMASSYVGGLSGAFIPVSEDQGMIDAVKAGALTIEKLEAMTCVCSVGLDMIAIPGDTKATTIAGIIADEMRHRYGQSEDHCRPCDSGHRKRRGRDR